MRRGGVLLGVLAVHLAACGPTAAEAFGRHYRAAVHAYAEGRRADAIAEYRAALQLRPDVAEAHNNLGVALYDIGRRDEAIAEYERALRLQPDYAEAHNNLGVALLSAGDVVRAVAAYRQAVAVDPAFTAARYNLCLGLELLGQLDEALLQCQIAAQREPNRPGLSATITRLRTKLAQP